MFVFLYLVSLYLYLCNCISSESISDFTWRPAAVCQGRELVRGHVGWESDLHSPLSSNSNSNSHLSSTLPGMITCAIFLVLALNHFNQADDAVSFETSTVYKKLHLLQRQNIYINQNSKILCSLLYWNLFWTKCSCGHFNLIVILSQGASESANCKHYQWQNGLRQLGINLIECNKWIDFHGQG